MTEQSFLLIPFPARNIPEITITGHVSRHNNVLALHYSLTGNLEVVFLPPTTANPNRKDELWRTTCFEFFLAIRDQLQYWEFNISPSGDWNVYHMDAYRRIGFREETSLGQLEFNFGAEAGVLTLDVAVDLNPAGKAVQEAQSFDVGVTAIIHTNDGNETYWALAHPASQADFHLRESFILALTAQPHRLRQSTPGD